MKAMMRKGKLPLKKINFVAMGGDGATADIGMGALSGALERGHDMIYVCYDNEAYMNTGIQRSSSTPYGASTTTSPAGKESIGQHTQKKNMPQIAVAHNIPYVATACSSFPFDLMEKVKRAVGDPRAGVRPHPVGMPHRMEDPAQRCHQVREAGRGFLRVSRSMRLLMGNTGSPIRRSPIIPVKEYLCGQGRFRHLTDKEIEQIQESR